MSGMKNRAPREQVIVIRQLKNVIPVPEFSNKDLSKNFDHEAFWSPKGFISINNENYNFERAACLLTPVVICMLSTLVGG